jgi:peptide deformylase
MPLPIVQTGDPVLRTVARELAPAQLPELAPLVEEMKLTMREAPGVGLAAPQIGLSIQLAVIEDRDEYLARATAAEVAERERRAVPFHVLVNPVLTVTDPTPVEFYEGCLSVEGFLALVPRARGVRVDALDENGHPVRIDAVGWYARILQHEIDHLNGKLYIDHMHTRSFCTHAAYLAHWRALSTNGVREALGIKATAEAQRR